MRFYPIILNLEGRPVTVIGGGEVALRKVHDLLESGAIVTTVSPAFHEEIEHLAKNNPGSINLVRRAYEDGDLAGAVLAFSATNDPGVNKQVFEEARHRGIFVNAVDDPPNCTFIVPSVKRRGDFIMAVSTGGASPAMAARLRRMIERAVPERIDLMLEALKEGRNILQNEQAFTHLSVSARGEVLKELVNDDAALGEMVKARAEGTLAAWLGEYVSHRKG